MNTTLQEQIQAIQQARTKLALAPIFKNKADNEKVDDALNDAASTIAAIKWNEENKSKKQDSVSQWLPRILILAIILFSSCTYQNICSKALQLKKIDEQIAKEYQTLKKIEEQTWTSDIAEQLAEEIDVIESLEIQKLFIEQYTDCR